MPIHKVWTLRRQNEDVMIQPLDLFLSNLHCFQTDKWWIVLWFWLASTCRSKSIKMLNMCTYKCRKTCNDNVIIFTLCAFVHNEKKRVSSVSKRILLLRWRLFIFAEMKSTRLLFCRWKFKTWNRIYFHDFSAAHFASPLFHRLVIGVISWNLIIFRSILYEYNHYEWGIFSM